MEKLSLKNGENKNVREIVHNCGDVSNPRCSLNELFAKYYKK